MTFARMNNISRGIREACGASTLGNLSDNKFLSDSNRNTTPCPGDDFLHETSHIPSVEDLRSLAEEEFINYYDAYPTCTVFAPGCLNLAGKGINYVESKSLSMAIQLVTLIAGKRSRGNKWCHVKTLSDEIAGEKAYRFYLNAENLDVSMEEASWIRYLKATIQSFRARGVHVPGFQIIIVSSVPVKRGLGSSSALVVGLYTFLEAITNTYTGNILEKTLACHLAEKLAVGSFNVRVADTLASVIGDENKIFSFDARSLRIDQYEWSSTNVELVLIVNDNDKMEKPILGSRKDIIRGKEILTIWNTTSRWRTHPSGTSITDSLFSHEVTNVARSVNKERERISRMIDTIRSKRWEELGKLLWENYHSTHEYLSPLSANIEHIMTVLKNIEGVLGANVISCDYGATVITLVQRSRLRTFIHLLSRIKISQQRCFITNSFTGATILYKYEQRLYPWNCTKRTKLMVKYHLRGEDKSELDNYNKFEPTKSLSLFIPQATFFD